MCPSLGIILSMLQGVAIHRYTKLAMDSSTAKQSVAFRFDPITVRRLKQRARETHAAQTALAERYIEEGLRRDEHPLISFRDGEAGRRPALLGTRLDVADIVETIRQNGNSVEDAADYLEIPVEHVEACLSYYADYKDEVDAWALRSICSTELRGTACRYSLAGVQPSATTRSSAATVV